jgi:hypothetical protein
MIDWIKFIDREMKNLRVREDELIYVLRKLLDLRLWPGTLWAAFSDAPSVNSSSLPGSFFSHRLTS